MAGFAFDKKAVQIIAEHKIESAMEAGEFDNLPGLGKPFEFDELTYDPNWWLKAKARREKLSLMPHPSRTLTNISQLSR